ncbi:hypothetical protein ACM14_08370 [Delftia sp. JD2]|nr:hypothetical protein ACM14_08370 [Delftia sp. JD2]
MIFWLSAESMIQGAIFSKIKRLARSRLVNLLIAALIDRSLPASVNTPVGIDIWLTLQGSRRPRCCE